MKPAMCQWFLPFEGILDIVVTLCYILSSIYLQRGALGQKQPVITSIANISQAYYLMTFGGINVFWGLNIQAATIIRG